MPTARCELQLIRQINDDFEPSVRFHRVVRPSKPPQIEVKNGRRERRIVDYRDNTFGICIWIHGEYDPGLFGRNYYWTISIPRGEKHLQFRERGKKHESALKAMAYARQLVARFAKRLANQGFVGVPKSENSFENYVLPGGANYTEWLITAPNLPHVYIGPHFDAPNVVAHVRTTEREVSGIGMVFVLEEIQSDWNQTLRDIDLNGGIFEATEEQELPPPENPYRHHWLEAALRMMSILAVRKGLSGIAWLPGRIHAERFPWANAKGLEGFYDNVVPKAATKLGKSWSESIQLLRITPLENNLSVRQDNDGKFAVIQHQPFKVLKKGIILRIEATKTMKILSSKDEIVSALLFNDAAREDILKNGLPAIGTIGQRVR